MPAARPHDQGGGPLGEPIDAAVVRVREADRAPDRVAQVDLTANDVAPGRRAGVLEVRHESLHGCIQGVDDHFPVRGTGDLDTAIPQIGWNGRYSPITRRLFSG